MRKGNFCGFSLAVYVEVKLLLFKGLSVDW